MTDDQQLTLFKEVIDLVLPSLPPYEFSLYLLLLRLSHIETGLPQLQIGKRTLAARMGQGTRSAKPNYQQISEVLKNLESKGYIVVGDATREGTVYQIRLPREISEVQLRIPAKDEVASIDYFNDPAGRKLIFDRDRWRCRYCGDPLRPDTASLDHFMPQCKGGQSTQENLRAACLVCNSIKSGKTYEEAAPLLLESLRQRKTRDSRAAAANQ